MRTLSATLTAAQKSLSSLPAFLVNIKSRIGGALRLSWTSLYSGSEADSYHAAICPADNSLVRARTDGATLYRQRIASPGAGSDYSVWSSFTDTIVTSKGIALATQGTNVALFYVADNVGVVTLYCRESTDSGATWGSPVQVATGVAADFEHIAAAYVSSPVLICFYTIGALSAGLRRIKRTSGVWGAAASWTNTVSALTGIGARFVTAADVHLLLTGKDGSSNYLVWGCVYGLGVNQADDTWSALKEIRKTHSGTSVSYKYPNITFPDVFRESFVEVYAGTESYTRTMGLHSQSVSAFVANLHHDDYRLPTITGTYGFALAHNATHAFLATSKGVYWAQDTISILNASPDIVSVKQRIRPFGGELEIILNNSVGIYNTPPFSAGYEIDFQPGYISTAGAEYSSGQTYYIETIEHITGKGIAQVRIIALDAWGFLGKNESRIAKEINQGSNEKTFKDLVEYFLNLAGFTLTVVSNSTPFTAEYPRVSIYSGETYTSFVKKLYERLTDLIYVRGTDARNFNPSASDSSVYSYGGSGHPLFSGRYSTNAIDFNRIQVQGAAVYSDAFVQSEIDRVFGRYRPFFDVNADTAAKASARAAALSTKEQYRALGGELVVPVNCGQELYDVIDITDSGAGLSAVKRRVFGIDLDYDSRKGRYLMELQLGAV